MRWDNNSEEQLEDIIRLWNDGLSMKDIAKHFGVHERTIRRRTKVLFQTGAMINRHQARLDEIVHLWTIKKWSTKAIARHFCVHQRIIWEDLRILKQSGVVLTNNRQDRLNEVARLWNNEGLSAKAIADIFCVDECTIHKYSKTLRNSGIEMPDKRGGIGDKTISEIIRLKKSGLSVNKIAQLLCLSKNTIWKYTTFREPVKLPSSSKLKTIDKIIGLPAWKLNIYQANVAHLIDLKRAGYSPTKTELNIPRGIPDYLPTYMEYAI